MGWLRDIPVWDGWVNGRYYEIYEEDGKFVVCEYGKDKDELPRFHPRKYGRLSEALSAIGA
ncbi:hypothetical protein [Thermococcus sp. GR4]|uniref:hypothetical protein n=1 Tax=Thermococcus sp. GR4 TaxID=1638254 RepID=UPI00142FE03F|nr:hypothetical protein [Thermococcus sp. GR4]NJE79599.1 hypothetical protein [Thermococcus sp. GR4]